MKKNIAILFVMLLCKVGFAQNFTYTMPGLSTQAIGNNIVQAPELNCELRGLSSHALRKEKLSKALLLSDLYVGYPSSWIESYVSTKITASYNNKVISASGQNEQLTSEQKNILKNAALDTEISLEIVYKRKNPVTNKVEIHEIHYVAAVVPEVEATSLEENLVERLKEKITSKMAQIGVEKFQLGRLRFTINEAGKVENARIIHTSDDPAIDKLLLDVINKMPKWKPATDRAGIPVKQQFEFSAGFMRGGC